MQYQGGKSRIAKQISSIIVGGADMRYQGGKSRIAKYISGMIGGAGQCNTTLVSLFCGGCSVEASAAQYFDRLICNDNHKYLIALLNGVKSGYELPDYVSEEMYQYVRKHKDDDPVLAGFVGFGCSFGGRFFQGYARGKNADTTERNYALQSKKSLLKYNSMMQNAEYVCMDYRNVILPDGCIVYCDPPYEGTKGYENRKFDNSAFWDYMSEISKDHLVYISELNAPDDFVSIWQKPITRTLDVNKNNYFKSLEQLFVHKSYEKLFIDNAK